MIVLVGSNQTVLIRLIVINLDGSTIPAVLVGLFFTVSSGKREEGEYIFSSRFVEETWKLFSLVFVFRIYLVCHVLATFYSLFYFRVKVSFFSTGKEKIGRNVRDDTDLLFLSGFPVWAKL